MHLVYLISPFHQLAGWCTCWRHVPSEFPKIQKQNHQSQLSNLVAFTSIQVGKNKTFLQGKILLELPFPHTKALPNALWLESWVFLQASIWGGQTYQTYPRLWERFGAHSAFECWYSILIVVMFRYNVLFYDIHYVYVLYNVYIYMFIHYTCIFFWVDSNWCLLLCVISFTWFIIFLIHFKSSHVWTVAVNENTWRHPKHGIIPLSQQLLAMSDWIFKLMWTYELHHLLRCWWQFCLNIKYWHHQSCCLEGTAAYFIRQHYFPLEVDKVQPSVKSGNGMAAFPLHRRTITRKHILICFKCWYNESEMMFQWIMLSSCWGFLQADVAVAMIHGRWQMISPRFFSEILNLLGKLM